MKKLEAVDATNSVEAAATAINGPDAPIDAPVDAPTAQTEANVQEKAEVDPEGLSPEELKILKSIRARQMLRTEDSMNIDSFGTDAINGWTPRMVKGSLGLVKVAASSGKPRLGNRIGNPGLFKGANGGETPVPEQKMAITAH